MSRSRKSRKSSAQLRRNNKSRRSHMGDLRSPFARRLHVEQLEDRRMLAVITVTSLADNFFLDGEVTLREAITAANTDTSVDGSVAGDDMNDTIVFDAALSGDTITLGGSELEITETLTIDATALANNVTIDAGNGTDNTFNTGDGFRIFNITAASGNFTLAGLILTGGDVTGTGGAIRSLTSGTLTIDQSTINGNSTTGSGGGIRTSSGAVTLTSSTVSGNDSGISGGGISTTSGAVTLTSSTVSGNDSTFRGGGISTGSGAVTLTSSTVSGNDSGNDGGGISTSSGAVTLTGSTVTGNSAVGA